jgi:predicted kinase
LRDTLLERCPAARLLLIGGVPATGKSRLARALAEALPATCWSKDDIKETLFDALGHPDRAGSRRFSNASFSLLFLFASRCLARPGLLLLEGNFRPGEHEAPLRRVLERVRAPVAQVLCVASPETRRGRLAARAGDSARHPGHQDRLLIEEGAPEAPPQRFLELPGPRLLFDSEGDWECEYGRILQTVRTWSGSSAEL